MATDQQQAALATLHLFEQLKTSVSHEDLQEANRMVREADIRGGGELVTQAWQRMAELHDRWNIILVARALAPLNDQIRSARAEVLRLRKQEADHDKVVAKLKKERRDLKRQIGLLRKDAPDAQGPASERQANGKRHAGAIRPRVARKDP